MSPKQQTGGRAAEGLEPKRAPVPPRVRIEPGTASLPIDRQVRSLLDKKVRGAVRLSGPAGSGKTTALAHLAAMMQGDWPVAIYDLPDELSFNSARQAQLVIYTSSAPKEFCLAATLQMSPWTEEDLAEYLLATHPGRTRAVMGRLKDDPRSAELAGVPELWRIVLDEMAADDALGDVDAALGSYLARELFDVRVRDAAERASLYSLAPWGITRPTVGFDLEERIQRIVRHAPIRLMLASRRLVDGLRDQTVWDEFKGKLPADLIARCGKLVSRCPASVQTLEEMARGKDSEVQAMAASLLHAADTGWRPPAARKLNLCDALLEGVRWSGVDLAGSRLSRADLRRAWLVDADLSDTELSYARLSGAFLASARLSRATLRKADLCCADLSGARLYDAKLYHADLTEAVLDRALLCGADFAGAILRRASLRGAELIEANLRGAEIDEADFSGSNLTRAELNGLSLRTAIVADACFKSADLSDCNLEEIEGPADFSQAHMENALLTGSVMRGANFQAAVLRGCGLADIDWEGADLREADLRGSTFHMGTTRSGLVESDVPSEGSRTGFYTDDFHDRDFKDPREIRKASLCDADLRGANVSGVDFYLVDLRGARYTADQAKWFARCGAITCQAR